MNKFLTFIILVLITCCQNSDSDIARIHLGKGEFDTVHESMSYRIPQLKALILDATEYEMPQAYNKYNDFVQIHGPKSFHWAKWDTATNSCELSSRTLIDQNDSLSFTGFIPGKYLIIVGQQLETVKGISGSFNMFLEVDRAVKEE